MKFDLPLVELRSYRPKVEEPAEFEAFWMEKKEQVDKTQLQTTFTRVDHRLSLIDVFDVTFAGFGGREIKGWLLIPSGSDSPRPVVVKYQGYGAGRGNPLEYTMWPSAGYATFIMDIRGQGALWSRGDTADPDDDGSPSTPGFVTRGVLDPHSYYYLRVFIDAYRAVSAAKSHPQVAEDRVIVSGSSQGGLLALAAAGLAGEVQAALIDMPFLCHVERALDLAVGEPYSEISSFCRARPEDVDSAKRTLSFFDGVNHARRCTVPALFSVGLEDTVCPPSTVFAAFNHYGGPAEIEVYPFGAHEVLPRHRAIQLEWLEGRGGFSPNP